MPSPVHSYNGYDLLMLAKTILGEARGESLEGQYAVGHVIRNRYEHHDAPTIAAVCLRPSQFSCWLPTDPNRPLLDRIHETDTALTSFLLIAQRVLNGSHADNTHGARHYYAGKTVPHWAEGKTPCVVIGHHRFFNDIA